MIDSLYVSESMKLNNLFYYLNDAVEYQCQQFGFDKVALSVTPLMPTMWCVSLVALTNHGAFICRRGVLSLYVARQCSVDVPRHREFYLLEKIGEASHLLLGRRPLPV